MNTVSACCTCIYSIRLCHIAFELETLYLILFFTLYETVKIGGARGGIVQSFPAAVIAKETKPLVSIYWEHPSHFVSCPETGDIIEWH